jgi:hypothetical protein
VGGNVLLMTRFAQNFIDAQLTSYLGVTWTSTGISLSNYTAVAPGLVNVPFLGSQSYNDVFSPTVGPESTLLFRDGSSRGVGVHAQPATGPPNRADGGRFVLLCGRPYRMGYTELQANVEAILDGYFGEPYTPPGPRRTWANRELRRRSRVY